MSNENNNQFNHQEQQETRPQQGGWGNYWQQQQEKQKAQNNDNNTQSQKQLFSALGQQSEQSAESFTQSDLVGQNNQSSQNSWGQPNSQNSQQACKPNGQGSLSPMMPRHANMGVLIAAIIMGAVGIVLCWLNVLQVPVVHIVGLGLGIAALCMGIYQFKRSHKKRKAMAIVAIVLGAIALGFGATLFLIGCAWAFCSTCMGNQVIH